MVDSTWNHHVIVYHRRRTAVMIPANKDVLQAIPTVTADELAPSLIVSTPSCDTGIEIWEPVSEPNPADDAASDGDAAGASFRIVGTGSDSPWDCLKNELGNNDGSDWNTMSSYVTKQFPVQPDTPVHP